MTVETKATLLLLVFIYGMFPKIVLKHKHSHPPLHNIVIALNLPQLKGQVQYQISKLWVAIWFHFHSRGLFEKFFLCSNSKAVWLFLLELD